MENNKKIWNREGLYSVGALILAIICELGLPSLFDKIDYSSVSVFKFNTAIYNISGGRWYQSFYDLAYGIPTFLSLALLITALFMGIKSIRKTSGGAERGRMVGIVSTSITAFILVIIVILTIFPL